MKHNLLQRIKEQNFTEKKFQNSLWNHNIIIPKEFSLKWRWRKQKNYKKKI